MTTTSSNLTLTGCISAAGLLKTLMTAIYQAREGPPGMDLAKEHSALLEAFKRECVRMSTSSHDKARALAVEFFNDWEAILVLSLSKHSWCCTTRICP